MKTQLNKQVLFKKWLCDIKIGKYAENRRKSIRLIDSITGEPVATASVNIPHVELKENEVAIKNYSENEGVLEALIKAGVVKEPGWFLTSGLVELPICEII